MWLSLWTVPSHVTLYRHEREVPAARVVYILLWSPTCKAQHGEEVRNDDHIDYSSSVVFARWRRVGIFSLARVASCAARWNRARQFLHGSHWWWFKNAYIDPGVFNERHGCAGLLGFGNQPIIASTSSGTEWLPSSGLLMSSTSPVG
jgi:hypothetical protein